MKFYVVPVSDGCNLRSFAQLAGARMLPEISALAGADHDPRGCLLSSGERDRRVDLPLAGLEWEPGLLGVSNRKCYEGQQQNDDCGALHKAVE